MEQQRMKRFLVTVLLVFLYRALRATGELDPEIAQELAALPEDLVVILGIENQDNGIAFVCEREQLQRIWVLPEKQNTDSLEIRFKTLDGALRLLFGRESMAKSFAKHQLLLKGEVRWAMVLLRCIERVEYYLFPKFITKKLFKLPSKTASNSLRIYWNLLF